MVKIQKLPKSRWREYRKIRLEALKKDPNAFCGTYERESAYKEDIWRGRIENALFATLGKSVVGMIVYIPGTRHKHIANIFGFYVRKSSRNKGYGKMLVERALLLAKKNSIKKVRLLVASTQKPAIAAYSSCGFNAIKNEKDKKEVYLLMEKIIG